MAAEFAGHWQKDAKDGAIPQRSESLFLPTSFPHSTAVLDNSSHGERTRLTFVKETQGIYDFRNLKANLRQR